MSENVSTEFEPIDTLAPEQEASPVDSKQAQRDFKIAHQRALKERKEKIRQNKEMVSDLELEVSYWKAKSDLLKYRFEKMDYYLKNLAIEPEYIKAMEAEQAKQDAATVNNIEAQAPILD